MRKERTVRMAVREAIPQRVWVRGFPLPRFATAVKDMTRRQFLSFWRAECARCGWRYDRAEYTAKFEDLHAEQNGGEGAALRLRYRNVYQCILNKNEHYTGQHFPLKRLTTPGACSSDYLGVETVVVSPDKVVVVCFEPKKSLTPAR